MEGIQGRAEGGLDPAIGGAAETETLNKDEGNEPVNREEDVEEEKVDGEEEEEGEEDVEGEKEEGDEGAAAGDGRYSILNSLPKEAKVKGISRPRAALPGIRAHGTLRFNSGRLGNGNARPNSRIAGAQVIAKPCHASRFRPV